MEKNTYYQKSKKDSESRIRIKLLLSSRKYDPKYSSRIRILILYPSRMQGSTMLLIPDPQNCKSPFKTLKTQRWHIFYFAPNLKLFPDVQFWNQEEGEGGPPTRIRIRTTNNDGSGSERTKNSRIRIQNTAPNLEKVSEWAILESVGGRRGREGPPTRIRIRTTNNDGSGSERTKNLRIRIHNTAPNRKKRFPDEILEPGGGGGGGGGGVGKWKYTFKK